MEKRLFRDATCEVFQCIEDLKNKTEKISDEKVGARNMFMLMLEFCEENGIIKNFNYDLVDMVVEKY